jgi:dienelactone hydrolase
MCCPSDALPCLDSSYVPKGTVETHDGQEFYLAPVNPPDSPWTPTSAVVICADVYGWNGGHTRAIADTLAGRGYLVVVPKLLTPTFEGGTDGDAMGPDAEFNMDWIKQFPWPVQKPKLEATMTFVRGKGVTKIAVMGFCYGGHPACWASSECSGMGPDVVAGVVFHPSMQLEQYAYGGDYLALVKSVQAPFCILTSSSDMDHFAEDGKFGEALRASGKGSECFYKLYKDMTHGWVSRGDLSDEKVVRDVNAAMQDAITFLEKYL